MTVIDKTHDRRKRSGNRPATDLYPTNYALTKTEYERRTRNLADVPQPSRGTTARPVEDASPTISVDELVRRAPGLTGVVHTLRNEGFDDATIARLLLTPDRRHGPRDGAQKFAVLGYLESVGGSISSTDGRCVDALARVLSTTSVAMQDTLHLLDKAGQITRTVSNAGTFRVSLT